MSTDGHWDVVLRPRLLPFLAYATAAVIAAAGVTFGLLLTVGSTGAVLRPADQVAIASLGIILAAAVLLLTRPRLRIGPAGLDVRNVLGYRLIPWSDVVDVSFHAKARWARVDLAADEYVPVLAIQSVDRDRAVAAMQTVRTLMARYRPQAPEAGEPAPRRD